jgi:hypothetical protein
MVKSEELMGKTEYLTLYMWRRINRCRYNQLPLCLGNKEIGRIFKTCCITCVFISHFMPFIS